MLEHVFLIALLVAFIMLLLAKTDLRDKIRNYFDKKGMSLIAKMLDCDFCFSFWLGVAIGLLIWAFTGRFWYEALFCTPPIVRFII